MVKYKCARCTTKLETEDDLGGQSEDCPVCGWKNDVPLSKKQIKQQKKLEKLQRKEQAKPKQAPAAPARAQNSSPAPAVECDATGERYSLDDAEPEMWYYSMDGQEVGPVPETILVTMVQSGQLPPETQVRPDGAGGWHAAHTLRQFGGELEIDDIEAIPID
jgi:DNA-directed RNA polymerase subunit RPC12/RpoP